MLRFWESYFFHSLSLSPWTWHINLDKNVIRTVFTNLGHEKVNLYARRIIFWSLLKMKIVQVGMVSVFWTWYSPEESKLGMSVITWIQRQTHNDVIVTKNFKPKWFVFKVWSQFYCYYSDSKIGFDFWTSKA